ncbi:recombinase family protein [Clostridium sp. 'White wine YQ']|uniref:recombinase family protein n=1 Tax=Clostridium sp. 'White wine YQ' TaxID=3027474 RepID=UPI0023667B83|nr:recombinase family protein [Clostridium sp. 'White wine YQ']MDD7794788.1 recombinase family protein [Clostridium sp. 'White wine YQ']
MPYKQFLGFKKGENGLPEIIPEEAEIVRLIYKLSMEGKTATAISRNLANLGILSPSGKGNWQSSTIQSILTNEKYKGSAVLQKKYTVDFLTKTMKVNNGEVPQYYVEKSNDFIIEPAEWELVQTEFERRKRIGKNYSGNSIFSAKIICGDCNGYFGIKVWHSTSRYRKTIYSCNRKFENDKKCSTPHITEDEIKQKFILAFNQLLQCKDEIIDNCKIAQKVMTNCTQIDADIAEKEQELEVVYGLIRKCIDENAHSPISQEEYQAKYEGLVHRYDCIKESIVAFEKNREERVTKRNLLDNFILELDKQDGILTEFDETLWTVLVNEVIVYKDRLVFNFKDGTEIQL